MRNFSLPMTRSTDGFSNYSEHLHSRPDETNKGHHKRHHENNSKVKFHRRETQILRLRSPKRSLIATNFNFLSLRHPELFNLLSMTLLDFVLIELKAETLPGGNFQQNFSISLLNKTLFPNVIIFMLNWTRNKNLHDN